MLELRTIAKAYGKKTVLANIDATLQPGTVTAVIGANGSGKSTLLKIIWGEISADEASRGNRKRLACALALLAEPSIILMDEPYSGLDVERSASLSGIIRLLAERGRTVLFSCHEESIIRAMADRFILIRDGMAECSPIHDMPFMAAESLAGKEALPWLS